MASNPALQSASIARSSRYAQEEGGAVASMLAVFARWYRLWETREKLGRLDDRLLRDIGFDPEQARREAAKKFWQPFTLARVSGR